MNRPLSIALLIVGIVLIIWGLSSADSFSSQFTEFFTGSPNDKTIWLMIGGIICAVVGFFGVVRRSAG